MSKNVAWSMRVDEATAAAIDDHCNANNINRTKYLLDLARTDLGLAVDDVKSFKEGSSTNPLTEANRARLKKKGAK